MNTTVNGHDVVLEMQPTVEALPAVLEGGRQVSILERSIEFALRSGTDLDQLQKLLDMKERYDATEAKKEFDEAMAAFKAEAVEIIKRKEVDFTTTKGGRTNYKHAELSDVIEAVAPALSKHGFSWGWKPVQTKDWIEITCTLKHRLGHSETATLGAPPDQSGGKNTIQAIVSTTTYLERHTLKAVCGVAEKSEDDDGRGYDGQRGTWSDEYLEAIDACADLASLQATWKTAAGSCRRKNDRKAYDDIKARISTRLEELGITAEAWAAAAREEKA
jgi:ERF superfamily